jgi:elongation factor 1-alpha
LSSNNHNNNNSQNFASKESTNPDKEGDPPNSTRPMTAPVKNDQQQQQQHLLNIMSDGHIRVAVVGNVDAGKSTMIGTLTRGTLDNGHGSSRNLVATHRHEMDSGRTSTISCHLIGFDGSSGTGAATIVVPPKTTRKNQHEAYIASHAHRRTVSLMDLAGHEKYFKTTIAGLSRGMADYALVLVNASHPPTHMTVHHLNLCNACGIPVVVVLTKLDSCPSAQVLRHTKKRIQDILRNDGMGKRAFAINQESDIEMIQDKLHALVPVIETSCVTGEGLDLLQKMLLTLPQRRKHRKTKSHRPFELLIEELYNVPGVGVVLTGFVNCGHWRKGEAVYIGPLNDGSYIKTTVKSAHVAQTVVDEIWAGHAACCAVSLTKSQRHMLLASHRKSGMVILKEPVSACVSFIAEICFTKGESVTMRKGQWQTTMNILHLKRTCRMVDFKVLNATSDVDCHYENENKWADKNNDDDTMVLRPGQRAQVKFAFVNSSPARAGTYIRKGMRVMLRDGLVRGIGIVTQTMTNKQASG